MKTIYTVPKLSSLTDNGIKDLFSIANYPEQLRLVQLEGIPVRIEINKKYVEVNSEEEELDFSKYNNMFEKLMEFFYGTTYLYGFLKEDKLLIYDVFTNDNYFSTRDMNYLEMNFDLPIVKPIAEGNFSFDYIIAILNKKINDEKMDPDSLFLLPTVYIDDKREYTYFKPELISSVVFGQKYSIPATTTPAKNTSTVMPPKKPQVFEVIQFSTKKEREDIFLETYKNVSKYYDSIKGTLSKECNEWFQKYGKMFTHLYSIHTLPSTRKIVYDYAKEYYLPYTQYSDPVDKKWSYLFIDFISELYYNSDLMKKYTFNLNDYDYFATIFKEELINFDKFFVKETNKEDDWRYGENVWGTDGIGNFAEYGGIW